MEKTRVDFDPDGTIKVNVDLSDIASPIDKMTIEERELECLHLLKYGVSTRETIIKEIREILFKFHYVPHNDELKIKIIDTIEEYRKNYKIKNRV